MSFIDAQFDRAVEIVQGLPKTGPIQTDYEEKLTMYSLYKQATVGNVKSPRPGIWDMLGRAKWDAWAKHKDLNSYEAKWLYVDALLKVLRKYSDKTMARNLVQELESYTGDASHIVMNRSVVSHTHASDSSGSSDDEGARGSGYIHASQTESLRNEFAPPQEEASGSESDEEEEEEEEDQAHELPSRLIEPGPGLGASQLNRPQSSLSSHRYRTPMAGSLAMSPPPQHGVPAMQPLPGFETPSAFAEPSPTSIPSSLYPAGSSYVGFSESSRGGMASPQMLYPAHPHYRPQSQTLPLGQYGVVRPASTLTMERAIESVQSQVAAVNERLEVLESISPLPSRSHLATSPRGTPTWGVGRGSPPHDQHTEWDLDDLGMWSLVLNPMARAIDRLKALSRFFARNENRSPSMVVLRRLCLDVSFLLCVIAFVRTIWKTSGVRRREVNAALRVLWRAILGRDNRVMVERGV